MVVWYKDNKKIDDNERYCSEEQGVFRSLVVLNAEIDDSGEYTCDAGDDKMVFYITVKGTNSCFVSCYLVYVTSHSKKNLKCLYSPYKRFMKAS